jgi:hypothetical protein
MAGRRVKCSFTRYKGILAGTAGKGKKAKGKGKKKWLYSLVVEVLKITRQEIVEIVEGTRVSTTAGARDQQEEGASTTAAHLQYAARLLADLWEFLSLSCTSLSSRGTLVANGAESIYRCQMLVSLDAHKTAMH